MGFLYHHYPLSTRHREYDGLTSGTLCAGLVDEATECLVEAIDASALSGRLTGGWHAFRMTIPGGDIIVTATGGISGTSLTWRGKASGGQEKDSLILLDIGGSVRFTSAAVWGRGRIVAGAALARGLDISPNCGDCFGVVGGDTTRRSLFIGIQFGVPGEQAPE